MHKEITKLLNSFLYEAISSQEFLVRLEELRFSMKDSEFVVEMADILHELSMFQMGFLSHNELKKRLRKLT